MTERFTGRLADVIRRPLITEKATRALEQNQYTFEVDHRAAKPDIKAAVEQLFDVKVTGISTMNPPRRSRRIGRFAGKRAQVKKAVVRLAEGNSIQLFPSPEGSESSWQSVLSAPIRPVPEPGSSQTSVKSPVADRNDPWWCPNTAAKDATIAV